MRTELIVWAGLALLLMAAETLAPGVFLLWLGFAAAAVFAILLVVPLPPVWQAVAFIVLAFLSIALYVRFFRGQERGCGRLDVVAGHRDRATSSFMISLVPP